MIWVLTILPIAFLLLGFPIFLVLLTTSAIALLAFMDVPLTLAHQVMFGSVDKFALMALPFFIFAGEIMGSGGISRRIVDWVMSIVGGLRGSLPLTTVGTCTVFGAISGSSPATVAAIGRLLYIPLREQGYNEKFSTSVIAASGGIASVIPPSISMILYGASAEQAITLLFIAGILPGLLIAFLMGLYVYVYAVHHRIIVTQKFRFRIFWETTKNGILALAMPGIILGGIYSGIFDPTEAAGVACFYAIFVTKFIYRSVSWKKLWNIGVRSMYLTAQIFIIVAAAGVYSWLLTVSGIPQGIVAIFENLNVTPWIGLLIINLFLLLVGCFVDPASAILILTPLLVPVVSALGIDLIHFGVILTVNLEIGMFTPPFGLNIFVAQALFRTPLAIMYKGLFPFILVNLIALMVISYVPEISMFLVRFAG